MSTRLLLIAILICLALVVHANLNVASPRVKTTVGKLKGYYKITQNSRQYEVYEGIPYAYPPIGKRRFQPPRALPPWIGELPATSFGPECLQYNIITENVTGSEDCLYLNIYVPVREKTVPKTPMPVLFWIHGGGFQFSSGSETEPEYIMDYDVIVVTINYRLGPFGMQIFDYGKSMILGFLSTEDEIVPGNIGLKDQNMALRWVSHNIEWFGGDAQKVTLVGMSAGGASVHYHYLSPMSAGLFQGGISISGTAFDCWAQTENSMDKAKQLSKMLGCPTINTKEMIHCLRYRPAHTITEILPSFMPLHNNPFTPFGPVPEKFGDIRFIDKTPAEIISNGEVQDLPWITSTVSEDGLFPVAMFINDADFMKNLNDNWDISCPILLDFNYTAPKEEHINISRLIRKHYVGTGAITKTNAKPLIKIASDRFFIYDSQKAARMQAEVNKNPVWYYYYSYRGAHSLTEVLSKSNDDYGVCHGDDVFSVLKTPWLSALTTLNDRNMQKHLIDMWISFATNGTPSVADVKWFEIDPSMKELQYLHLANPTKIYMDSDANLGDKEFWDSINLNENKLQHKIHKHTTMRKEL